MEALHSMRFLAEILKINPQVSQAYWSRLYRAVGRNPNVYPCGCPNQDVDALKPAAWDDGEDLRET